MYHHIGYPPPTADAIRRDLTVTPEAFETQMSWFKQQGYDTISLGELIDGYSHPDSLPAKPVILTFDDGYDDAFIHAFPILKKYGFKGTFFIISRTINIPGYLSAEQLKEMSDSGMSIEAHCMTHADLTKLSLEEVRRQAVEPRQAIEACTGKRPDYFCYPSGKYNGAVIEVLRESGYSAAVTTSFGARHQLDSIFELKRIRVKGADRLEDFVLRLKKANSI